jgi:2-amino-4-hydroxy-6-hydroxymethyldihydropteridine diphosphokinase
MYALIGLGTNLHAEKNMQRALMRLALHPKLTLHRISTIVRTLAATTPGDDATPDYLNAAALLETELTPLELKQALRALEDSLGRTRTAGKPALIAIDLDLLLLQDHTGNSLATNNLTQVDTSAHRPIKAHDLTAPYHLIPAAEIAPLWRDPASGLTLQTLAEGTQFVKLEKVVL